MTDTNPVADTARELVSSARVEGTPVYDAAGCKLGHIHAVMIHKRTGQVAYALLSFGGFLGVPSRVHPIPWEKLTYNPSLDAYELDIADDSLRGAPSYADDSDFTWSRDQDRRIYDYYQVPPYWTI